jgi:hypothetical protein
MTALRHVPRLNDGTVSALPRNTLEGEMAVGKIVHVIHHTEPTVRPSLRKRDKFPIAVLLHAAADDLALQNVERGKQRRGGMRLVVVRNDRDL